MHIGYFSTIMGTKGGPALVDREAIKAISEYDHTNSYTVYNVTKQSTNGLTIENKNFLIRNIKPSGKWLATSFGLPLELKRNPVDLLHATLVPPLKVSCKLILTMTCWSQYSQPEFYPPMIRWRLQFLINRGVKMSSAIFCYTEFLKNKIVDRFKFDPERIFILQPGVGKEVKPVTDRDQLKDFLKHVGIDSPYILYIGTITKRKNIEGLIKAYNILVKEAKIQHKLVLLGEKGYYSDDIFKIVKEFGLEGNVLFIGRHPYHELRYFYSGADVYVLPTFSEGFGLTPLESMACGTPVVASNTTSVPEVVGDAALLVDPYQPEDIAEKILKYLTDDLLCDKMVTKGFSRIQEFTWQRTAMQSVNAYEKVYEAGW